MHVKLLCAALIGAMALVACETTEDYGGGPPRTQLSQCGRNALLGAGIGAVAGAVIGDEHNRAENAAIGAAVVGAGTYGICRYLSAREQQRVENAYYQSLSTGRPVSDSWQSDQGGQRSLHVSQPTAAPDLGPRCRRVTATVEDPQYGTQQLPPETFCRASSGEWVPA